MTDWQRLIDDHGALVWKAVYRLLGHQGDAEDCFQATFLAAWRLDQRETVRNWPGALLQIATARALECLRARIRGRRFTRAELPDEPSSAATDPVDHAAGAELADRISQAIAELSPTQAAIVSLVCIEGRSNQEVAEMVGMTPNHVGVELHRARRQLRRRLAEVCDSVRSQGES